MNIQPTTVRLTDKQREEMIAAIKSGRYATESDFIRSAVRAELDRVRQVEGKE